MAPGASGCDLDNSAKLASLCSGRGIYIGFPLLQVWNMAFDEQNALIRGVQPFPHMVKWIRS